MARNQSSFNYDALDSATQDFLRQKERDIHFLISKVGLKIALTDRYRIGEKVVEVRSDLEKNKVKYWTVWIEKVLGMPHPAIYDEYVYLYKYTNDYLGGIAVLEANPKIKYSVLCKLGRPKTPVYIKQKFAERIKSGERIIYEKVEQAIANELLTTIPSNQVDNLEKPLFEIKKLLNSRDNQELNYHKWLQSYDWVFGFDYKLIESHKKLDDKRIPDFTGIRVYDDFRDIFEIKPPFIPLFQKNGEFTSEFNKAWNQIEEYLNFVIEDKDYLRRDKGLNFDNPKCYLILGYDLSENPIKKIRTKARMNPAIDFRTYNNLIAWAENTIKFVKKHKVRK
jgi:hypothetical protein